MGWSANVTVTNNSPELIKVQYEGGNCMDGTGSWDQSFIPQGQSYPTQGIEASQDVLNGCFDMASHARYNIVKLNMTTGKFETLSSFTLRERKFVWIAEGGDGLCQFQITNGPNGGTIDVSFGLPQN